MISLKSKLIKVNNLYKSSRVLHKVSVPYQLKVIRIREYQRYHNNQIFLKESLKNMKELFMKKVRNIKI